MEWERQWHDMVISFAHFLLSSGGSFMSFCILTFIASNGLPTTPPQNPAGSGWVSEWVSEWVGGWVSEWVSVCVSEWVSVCVSECVSEWVGEWVSECVCEWVSEWGANEVFQNLPPVAPITILWWNGNWPVMKNKTKSLNIIILGTLLL